jgi:hypothetical protein
MENKYIYRVCKDMIARCNNALVDINGVGNLPVCLEKLVNSRLNTISADTLQGIKIGMMYILLKVEEEDAHD